MRFVLKLGSHGHAYIQSMNDCHLSSGETREKSNRTTKWHGRRHHDRLGPSSVS